ncbi:hypothetical protein KBTX_04484 [wastewater metagenome]|uniref:Uncharacterized protein n=2 Tax=unclassified sequences TaxID=12908 RepID=A0A5B8RJA3_9ZZZZ|nr:hypothetical protein KBTEX_04484 [uncultured organism]
MHAREQADAEDVHVLLQGGIHDLLGGAVQAGVDDVHTRIPQGPGDDLHTAVVAVEADLGQEYPDDRFALSHFLSSSLCSHDLGRLPLGGLLQPARGLVGMRAGQPLR